MDRAVTSASNIFRRSLCPGSERLEAGLPDEDSDESREGTLLHKFAADLTLDRSKLKPAQRDLLEINDRLIREVFERVTNQFGLDAVADANGREQEFWLHRGIKSLFPGHVDLYELTRKLLVILDYKFGYKIVTTASANLQLRSYAVMGAEKFDVDHCVVAITQPRLSVDDRLTMAVYSRADIEASRQQLYQIWDASKAPDAPLVAGEEQCRYCRAKLICPEFRKSVTDPLALVPASTGTKAKQLAHAETTLAQCSDVDLGRILDAIQFADLIKDTARDVARERIRAGGMDGYRLGKESEVREITDPVGAIIRIASSEGLDWDEVARRAISKFSIGAIEELYREKHGGTWQDARDKVNTVLASTIERKSKKPAIEKVKALPA